MTETEAYFEASHPLDYRYAKDTRPVFTEGRWYGYNWTVETALARVQAYKLGMFSTKVADTIAVAAEWLKKNIKTAALRVRKREEETGHDLMSMVEVLAEACVEIMQADDPELKLEKDLELGKEAAGRIHELATSYDIEDTAQVLRLLDAYKIICPKITTTIDAFVEKAVTYASTPCIGRTHGQHAVPTTFGFKYANFAHELKQQLDNLDYQMHRIKGKFSGAVGAYNAATAAGVDGRTLERLIGEELGIEMADISTQVVARAPYADLVQALASTGEVLERHAKEIRNLARTEIGEVREPARKRHIGSSTMPHKKHLRNPVNSENVCGLARKLRANVHVANENVALEHERDLTNSGPERDIFFEQFGYLDEMLTRTRRVTKNLEVFPDRMLRNLHMTHGIIMDEQVMTIMTERGANRQETHTLMTRAVDESVAEGVDFITKLKGMPEVTKLISPEELEKLTPEGYKGKAPEVALEIAGKFWKIFGPKGPVKATMDNKDYWAAAAECFRKYDEEPPAPGAWVHLNNGKFTYARMARTRTSHTVGGVKQGPDQEHLLFEIFTYPEFLDSPHADAIKKAAGVGI